MNIIEQLEENHYHWGSESHGWFFLKRDELSIIVEEVPPGDSEIKHKHEKSRQFFYIISGMASMEIGSEMISLIAGQGIEIPPGTPHKFENRSKEMVKFLVVSMPQSHGDRLNLE